MDQFGNWWWWLRSGVNIIVVNVVLLTLEAVNCHSPNGWTLTHLVISEIEIRNCPISEDFQLFDGVHSTVLSIIIYRAALFPGKVKRKHKPEP